MSLISQPIDIRYKMHIFLCSLLLLTALSHSQPDRFMSSLHSGGHQEYLEVSYPPPSHEPTPTCSHQILRHSFTNPIDFPLYSTTYSPPSQCPPPWSHVVLHFQVKCKGQPYNRIAALWLGGAELLRTSTAEPMDSKIFWNVRKDVTRYSSLLAKPDLNLTMMLENIVNHEKFTGNYHVTITLLYYIDYTVREPFNPCPEGLEMNPKSRSTSRFLMHASYDSNESPAHLIIPISDDGKLGFWFRVEGENDLRTRRIRIPQNTHKAVLELYVSFHGNDEFWYSNPPNSYIKTNSLTTERGNGAYREVYVTIDGEVVGWEVPFPVIFTGGINPLFWEPIVAIGAFNLPSYDMELTPFLGKLLDGKEHDFGIGVVKGISYWLVNANLHLWLDRESSVVHASRVTRRSPETNIERQEEFIGLDGEFEVEAEKETQVAGWVLSSSGNTTTVISQGFSFRNFIKFQRNGTYMMVKQKFKTKKKVKVTNHRGEMISRLKVKRKYPLRLTTLTEPYGLNERYRVATNVSHAFDERIAGRCFINSISNAQDSKGWMEVKGHNVLSGQATTKQSYSYVDKSNCYNRNIAAANGRIVADNSTFVCENSL